MELTWPKQSTDLWFIVPVSLSVYLTIRAVANLLSSSPTAPLPPGPCRIPIISDLRFLRMAIINMKDVLRDIHAKYGPIFTLPVSSGLFIYIADRSLAHQALVQNGAVFSDRPEAVTSGKVFNSNQHDINSAFYGPTWRALRRNLTSEMLHPTRIKSFSVSRKWVLDILIHRLKSNSDTNNSIKLMDHLQYAMLSLLAFMCFGEKLDEKKIKEIENVQRRVVVCFNRFKVLDFLPRIVTRLFFRQRWQELFQLKWEQDSILVPLIRARKKAKEETNSSDQQLVVPYVDTLLDLEWPEEKRKLKESEIVSASSELLSAGTDTTATALQWIMANAVKYPKVQEKIVEEIREAIGDREDHKEVKDEDLNPYLKAVILEGLRRHPPAHFLVPHAVTEDVVFNGSLIPKNGI